MSETEFPTSVLLHSFVTESLNSWKFLPSIVVLCVGQIQPNWLDEINIFRAFAKRIWFAASGKKIKDYVSNYFAWQCIIVFCLNCGACFWYVIWMEFM